jgi:hypothetical protein
LPWGADCARPRCSACANATSISSDAGSMCVSR